ncbi:hypothetical protein [Janibacter cremeus]|uniref:Uncharacterized protein n=1 Tax=Janibacter cremeus TaxID=1285192 RepID=A0A852VUN2_9MICO|nr:hypothetical protein [Janibacter cremeus]NYF99679.1 hypothetical protein [Janibacter cremeus]
MDATDAASSDGSHASEVERLGPEMTGRWRVVTQRAVHLWDLDRMAYVRLPGFESDAFDWDGTQELLVEVREWPVVDKTFYVYIAPPENPLAVQ